MPEVAIVVPVFDNLDTLPALAEELTAALDQMGCDWEVVWVDDASTDGSWDWIRARCGSTPGHRAIRLDRNRGQSVAVAIGVAHVPDGAVVVTIDADLEYSPADIDGMVTAVVDPWTFVAGIRAVTGRRTSSSVVFNAMTRLLTGDRVGDVGCGFLAIGTDLAAEAGRVGLRALAFRSFLADRAGATIRREVTYLPTGGSAIGGSQRARIALDLLAADPRPVRRLGTVTVGTLALAAATGFPKLPGAVGIAVAGATVALGIRRSALQRAFRRDPPVVAESVPASPGTAPALANRSTTGHHRAQ